MAKKKSPIGATQNYVPISEIRDSTVVLNDGSLRQIIRVTPIPVDLRTPAEQEAVFHQYRSFLNSLKFPIQIVIQSRRVDLSHYVQKLQTIAVQESNELLKIQLADYLEFIQRLSEEVNIMDRSFYLVTSHAKIPTQSTITQKTILDRFLGGKKTKETVYSVKEFQELLGQLKEKTQIAASRLEAMGVKTEVLNTEGLIELYYNTYNPEESGSQKLAESRSLTGGVVQKEVGQIPAPVQAALNEAKTGSVLVGPAPLDETRQSAAEPALANQSSKPSIPDPLEKEVAEPVIKEPIISRKRSLREILTHLGQRQPQTESELEWESLKKGLADVLDIISPAGLAVNANYLQLGNFYARTLFVFTYPRYLSSGWLSPVLNIDTTIDVSMFIYPIETSTMLANLRRKTTQLQSSLQIEQEKGLVRNPELETAIGDIEELRDTLQKGETRLFQSSLYFTLYAKSLEDLQKLTKQVETTLGGTLIYTKVALLQMEPGFNSTLPIASNDLDIVRNLDTESLATSFPFSSQDLSHHDGVLYGINLHNSSLVLFDRFRMENANQVVFAKSGAGKSYAVKLEALRLLMTGTEIIIIDPENEYQALAQTVGGTFIELSLNSSQKINPFDLPRFTNDDQDTGEDLLRGTVAGLHGLLSLMAGGLSAEEDAILDKALYETYALKDITVDPKTQSGNPPLMIDLVGVLANISGAENLVNRLLKFTEGSYSNLFNAPTNIDLTNRATVFSIRNMEDELRPLAMYLVLNYIWSRVKSELKRRLLIIDEAWWMMRFEDTAKFLNAMTKRARKYYLGVTVVSQDVEDFIDNNYGKAIVSNSATQLLLGQAPSAVDKLAGVFKLTEGEKQFLLGTDVGQGLLVAGLDRAAVQVIASYTEDQFITTNPEQLLAMFGREG